MKYRLDIRDSVEESLTFWAGRHMRQKMLSLSRRTVKDKTAVDEAVKALSTGRIQTILALDKEVRKARNAGLSGLSGYWNPVYKFYHFVSCLGFSSMHEINEETIAEFLVASTSDMSDATRRNFRVALINFFGYIDKNNNGNDGVPHTYNIVLKNWGGLRATTSGNSPIVHLSEEEARAFISAIGQYKWQNGLMTTRNRLMIKLLIFTGIRVGELLGLQEKDIAEEDENYVFQVRGKGNKHRIIMLRKEAIKKELDMWMELRDTSNDLLFANKGKPLTQAYIGRMVAAVLDFIEIKKGKKGAHLLRHTYASMLYKKSQDIVLVQEVLGHSDVKTSRMYVHFERDRLKAASDVWSGGN